MKLRKTVLSLALAALLCAALAVPAFAAEVDLGEAIIVNNGQQKGWGTDGMDGKASHLTLDDFLNAKYLVLELAEKPAGQIQVVWQGDGDGWGWNQTDEEKGEVVFLQQDSTYVIDLPATLKKYDKYEASTAIKILVCYYDSTFEDLGIQKAYLTDTAPAGANTSPIDSSVKGDKENNPQTGDNLFLYAAIAALAVTGCAAVILSRKTVKE